jgi:uncharacterized membrane protein
MGRLVAIWLAAKASLWLVPGAMVCLASVLALGLLELDSSLGIEFKEHWPRFFGISADGSRTILSVIAGSVITVAGVTFSITIVALSLAANQYTSRVLRNFMRDRINQAVLGALVSVFVYCLIVLRTVQGSDSNGAREDFIPSLSITVAIVLAVIAMGLFILFIHHVATTVQVSSILNSVRKETGKALDALFPDDVGDEKEELEASPAEQAALRDDNWKPVPALKTGYIQTVASESLIEFCEHHGALVKLERSIGDFVIAGTPLVSVACGPELSEAIVRTVNRMLGIADYRTIEQDPKFGIQLIVDIAVRALSPGTNDPTTVSNCLDHLSAILRQLARRRIPSPFRYSKGELRVIAPGPNFEQLMDQMFSQIRRNARSSVTTILNLLSTIERGAEPDIMLARRRILLTHVHLIAEQAREHIRLPHDGALIETRIRSVTSRLQGKEVGPELPLV